MAVVETRTSEWGLGNRVSWGAIFAGTIISLGVWLLLYSFGLAVGLSSIDPADASSLKGVGIGTGIWSLVTPLIALFVGGFAAARLAGFVDRGAAGFHGLVVWALTTLAAFFVLTSILSAIIGGAATMGGKAVSGAMSGGGDVLAKVGVDEKELMGPLNTRLREAGKPEITADQFKTAMKDALGTSVREGRFDRQVFTDSFARATALSPAEVEDVAVQVEQQVGRSMGGLQQGALQAAESSGAAFWALFGALLLSLVSAVLGALTGFRRMHRHEVVRRAPTGGEVYP